MRRIILASPHGDLLAEATDRALVRLGFLRVDVTTSSNAVLDHARRELEEYFAGSRRGFTIPVAPEGTPFQRAVWRALRRIPYGETAGYGEIARRIGRAGAARAVGGACGANPVAIVLPCHRVVGSNGSLTGFSAGLDRKVRLLDHERSATFARRRGRIRWTAGRCIPRAGG